MTFIRSWSEQLQLDQDMIVGLKSSQHNHDDLQKIKHRSRLG